MAPADRPPPPGRRRGFTLVEVMVAAALGAIILAAVLTAFIYLARSANSLNQYSELQMRARRVMLQAGNDLRQATGVTWVDARTLAVTVDGTVVTYAYDAATQRLTRTPAGGTTSTLAANLVSFQFNAYNLAGTALDLTSDLTAASNATKIVQLQFTLRRTGANTADATDREVSARFLMRNKQVP